MLRAKAARAEAEGVTRQDAWLGNVDRVGALGSATAPLANWANDFEAAPRRCWRRCSASTATATCRASTTRRSRRWFQRARRPARAGGRRTTVAFFYTCSVNYNEPQVGRDAVSVLEKNGCAVSCPQQVCCGMPYLDGGRHRRGHARTRAGTWTRCCRWWRRGRTWWCRSRPAPTSSRRSTRCWCRARPRTKVAAAHPRPLRVPGRAATGRARSPRTSPARARARSPTRCPATCAPRTWATRRATSCSSSPAPRSRVVERCTAMDGTWAMKKEYYPISLQFARKAAAEMEAAAARHLRHRLLAVRAADRGRARRRSRAHPIEPPARGLRPARGALRRRCSKVDRRSREVKDLVAYEKVREDACARGVIALKRDRRAPVGDEPDPPLREPRDRAVPDPGDGPHRADRGRRRRSRTRSTPTTRCCPRRASCPPRSSSRSPSWCA